MREICLRSRVQHLLDQARMQRTRNFTRASERTASKERATQAQKDIERREPDSNQRPPDPREREFWELR
jgi:hypothetical protein